MKIEPKDGDIRVILYDPRQKVFSFSKGEISSDGIYGDVIFEGSPRAKYTRFTQLKLFAQLLRAVQEGKVIGIQIYDGCWYGYNVGHWDIERELINDGIKFRNLKSVIATLQVLLK